MDPKIVEQIEKIIALEDVTPEGFSRALFGFGGLFQELGKTEAERRVICQSDLFQRANKRMSELERRELAIIKAQRRAALASIDGVSQPVAGDASSNGASRSQS